MTILGSAGLLAVFALGLAALRNASPAWVTASWLMTLTLLGAAALGVAYRRSPLRISTALASIRMRTVACTDARASSDPSTIRSRAKSTALEGIQK